uniref:Protein TIC 20 n=1 Tax=Tetraselmis chuii TaxID=63592 RepID=A0A7S1T0E5_9CHLO|mmetsp:Transcript_39039/g.69926  ORF Transcript_39039/g.69926 Transcript_39039/m.69926 type:complete len:251 (+) Transcript_39039:89-841(+)
MLTSAPLPRPPNAIQAGRVCGRLVAVAVDTPPRKRPSLLFAAAHRRVRLLKGCTWRAQTEIFAPKLPVGEIKANAARRVRLLVRDSRNGGQSEQVSFTDRLVAALAYLLPLMAGLRYGRFFFREFPISAQILVPLQPVIQLYYYTPLSGFIIFLGLYMGIALNRNFSRFVRFNAMQAILLDISLSYLPSALFSITPARTYKHTRARAYTHTHTQRLPRRTQPYASENYSCAHNINLCAHIIIPDPASERR